MKFGDTMRKLTLEERINRLERLINEKKIYTSDINKAKDLLVKLLDDKNANKDNLTIKDLNPREIDHPQYGKVLRVERNGLNLAHPKFKDAIDKWMSRNKGYKWAFWWTGVDDELMDVVVYTVKEENKHNIFKKCIKNESVSFTEDQRSELESLLEGLLNHDGDDFYGIDVNDENAIYGYLNVGIETPEFEIYYDVVNNDGVFEILDENIVMYKCKSLQEVANTLAKEVWQAEADM